MEQIFEKSPINSGVSVRLQLPTNAEFLRAKIFQSSNKIIASTLSILEEIADEHESALLKLKQAIPSQYSTYIDLAAPMTESRFETLRSRILKVVNDNRRDLEEVITNLRIE